MTTLLSPDTQKTIGDRIPNHYSSQSVLPKMTKHYPADQQVKYLHLQAEIEVLLQELQTIKQHKGSSELSVIK